MVCAIGAGTQQAMVVVDEVDETIVDTLVVGDVGVGSVDPHGLAQHLGERPAAAHQIIVGFTGADLVAGKDAILELVVKSTRWRALGIDGCGKRHGNDPRSRSHLRFAMGAAGRLKR
jgi:hypothetical protein